MKYKNKWLAILFLASFSIFIGTCSSGDKKEESKETTVTGSGESASTSTPAAPVTAKCSSGDCKNGKGVLEYSNGDKYEGNFKDGKFDGKGKYTFRAGDVYEGDFSQDKFSGNGKYSFANGDVYEGDFKNDVFHGKGKLKTAVATYEGDFKEGKMEGKGKLTQPDGDSFEGDFLADAPYRGIIKSADGKVRMEFDATKPKLGR